MYHKQKTLFLFCFLFLSLIDLFFIYLSIYFIFIFIADVILSLTTPQKECAFYVDEEDLHMELCGAASSRNLLGQPTSFWRQSWRQARVLDRLLVMMNESTPWQDKRLMVHNKHKHTAAWLSESILIYEHLK